MVEEFHFRRMIVCLLPETIFVSINASSIASQKWVISDDLTIHRRHTHCNCKTIHVFNVGNWILTFTPTISGHMLKVRPHTSRVFHVVMTTKMYNIVPNVNAILNLLWSIVQSSVHHANPASSWVMTGGVTPRSVLCTTTPRDVGLQIIMIIYCVDVWDASDKGSVPVIVILVLGVQSLLTRLVM